MAKAPVEVQEVGLLDPATLRVLADPLRSFVVYSLAHQAKTARQLAEELGCPTTRLYYHLEQLQKHGLIFVESSRQVSGITEKHYRAAARDWLLARERLAPGTDASASAGSEAGLESLLAYVLDQTRLDIKRQAAAGTLDLARRAPDPASLIAYRNVLKLSPQQAERLYARLLAFWQEYEAIAKQPATEGDFYAFAVCLYPNALGEPQVAASPSGKKRKRS